MQDYFININFRIRRDENFNSELIDPHLIDGNPQLTSAKSAGRNHIPADPTSIQDD